MNGAIHGLKRKYVTEKFDEIVSFAELESFIDVPVRTYSAGMYMRLGFSIAAHIDPDVLLLDEVFAVGDESFQRKCMGKILDLKARGRTLLFVSHSAPAVERLCERAMLLNGGELVADGPARDAIAQYQRMLAEEEDPAERSVGLREWGPARRESWGCVSRTVTVGSAASSSPASRSWSGWRSPPRRRFLRRG
jgi:ABC-type polysaccharide/polyol phosphate transport system ATPase subunit